MPTINPDGRAHWFQGPNNTHSSRSGKAPHDDDRDGLVDEDGYDDLNGDGQVTLMRRRNPHGRFKSDPEDPRALIAVKTGMSGEFDILGYEGIDNDGDGRINEDPPGGYDMNRNWPADWQPDHIQGGAGDFPLCWPETRAVADFLVDHPNIAGVQSFHNAAGMILRGPGHPSRQGEYPGDDDRVAAEIGRVGERMIPFYKSLIIHKDLYQVHGGFVTWTFEHLGIVSFTNELWNTDQLLGRPAAGAGTPPPIGNATESDQLFANDKLLFGATFVPWKPFKHPLYGAIEIGGFVKQSERIPPTFLIEELCHRNAAFVAYHARQMPLVEWDSVTVDPLGPDTYSLTASLRNTRLIPTVTSQSSRRRLGLPDTLTLTGPDLTVISGGLLVNLDTGEVEPAEHVPSTLRLPHGVPHDSPVRVRWFVRGKGKATLHYSSQKAKGLEKVVELKVQSE